MAKEAKNVRALDSFRRETQRRLTLLLTAIILINFGLGFFLWYVVLFPKEADYYATSVNGKAMSLVPLNEPNLADSAVLQWANQAAITAFTYDFVNYNEQLLATYDFFTAEGWIQFVEAVRASNSVEVVQEKKLIVSAVAMKPPIILQKGVVNGVYSWKIQMPLLITYRSASEVLPEKNVLTMLVTRVPPTESYKGIGIAQFTIEAGLLGS
jgi:intracellular multiplication protein IcmL